MAHKERVPLFDTSEDQTLRIQKELAVKIGFNEAVILMQIEYLISISNHPIDGNYWTYQSLEELKENSFPWWSIATISRTLKSLKDQDVIFIDSFNKRKGDKTQWFALNIERVRELGIKFNDKHPIFHFEKWVSESEARPLKIEPEQPTILQDEIPIFQNAKPILQDETTLPKNTPIELLPNGNGCQPLIESSKDKTGPKWQLMNEFLAYSGLTMPYRKKDRGFWWSGIGELYELFNRDVDVGKRMIRQVIDELRRDKMRVAGPESLIKTARDISAQINHKPRISLK